MKILLATDGSKNSEEAVETLNHFKFSDGDQIKIISVVDMMVPFAIDLYGGNFPSTVDIEKNVRENVKKVLETTSQKISSLLGEVNVIVSTEILYGSPESRIVESAEKMPADLIIVGSRGYNRWERLLLGSVSNTVVQHAHCSVLVVRS
ncbi:MAG: universal stress protein [Acidobacteria bacterium]|nr:universal stress protein [Acidobacteriota bacterium]MCA1637759.1 universal stress protein [Acidobacteriota bacterium]